MALALAVLGAACGDDGDPAVATGGDPSRTIDGVEVGLEADLTAAAAVTGTVEIRNDGNTEVWIYDGMATTAGAGTSYDPATYALLDAGDGVMEVAQRAIDPPEGVDLDSLAVLAVRRLAPGDATSTDITVPLPPTPTGPYASLGQEPPADPDDLVVCVGAVLVDGPAEPRTGDGVPDEVEALASHGAAWVDAQAIVCSDPLDLH